MKILNPQPQMAHSVSGRSIHSARQVIDISVSFVPGPRMRSRNKYAGKDFVRVRELVEFAEMLSMIDGAACVDYVVLSALDSIFRNGRPMSDESAFVLSNSDVIEIAAESDKVLFGASVHPYRELRGLLEETARCVETGAVLFNWMPSIQRIDPEDSRCIPFYVKIAREGVPLMVRSGITSQYMSRGNTAVRLDLPGRLVRPLELGVKIIAVHASPYLGEQCAPDRAYFNELIAMLKQADKRDWSLYVDVSSFVTPSGMIFLDVLKSELERGAIDTRRLLYGSGLPLSSLDMKVFGNIVRGGDKSRSFDRYQNPLDDCLAVFRQAGLPEEIFGNSWSVLKGS